MLEKVNYLNQPNCYKLSNAETDVIVTTDTGPRILRYGFAGEENVLGECPELALQTAWGEWKPWGGHRLWAAPEALPRSYAPDNDAIEYHAQADNGIRLVQPTDLSGLQKEITVTLAREGTCVTVHHKITNKTLWPIEIAPWAITIMRGGGETILPQSPFRSHDEQLLPAQPIVRWSFTDLSDARYRIGERYLRLRTNENLPEPQKIGLMNTLGWCAYYLAGTLFVKRFDYREKARYTDFGCNNEAYTAGSYMEIETLGALQNLEPDEFVEHTERWYLFRGVEIGATEATLAKAIDPLIKETK